MTAAIFTLIGTALGVLGTVAAQLVRARTDDSRTRREQLRSACADFASSLARLRELGLQLFEPRFDSPQGWESIREAHLEARAHYERLRLTSSSRDVQEAGRRALRYAFGVMLQAAGKDPREDERERGSLALLNDSLIDLYAAVRRELGLPHPDDVYREPDEWLVPYKSPERAKAAEPTEPGQSATA
jgi:hypothetical protein